MLTKQEESLLKEAQAIKELCQAPGWAEFLKPWLEAKLNQSFPDPSQFKEESEFTYAAKTASVFKKVIAEILIYTEGQQEAFDRLIKKKKQGSDPYAIGK